jgi:hypothetical protein
MCVALRYRLERRLGRRLPATATLEHGSVERLADFVGGLLGGSDADARGTSDAADAVRCLSDREVEALLERELAQLAR